MWFYVCFDRWTLRSCFLPPNLRHFAAGHCGIYLAIYCRQRQISAADWQPFNAAPVSPLNCRIGPRKRPSAMRTGTSRPEESCSRSSLCLAVLRHDMGTSKRETESVGIPQTLRSNPAPWVASPRALSGTHWRSSRPPTGRLCHCCTDLRCLLRSPADSNPSPALGSSLLRLPGSPDLHFLFFGVFVVRGEARTYRYATLSGSAHTTPSSWSLFAFLFSFFAIITLSGPARPCGKQMLWV